jgi:hypothetical protein
MRYQFINEGCPKAGHGCSGCCQEIEFPMATAPGIGAKRKCPFKGCDRKVVRIISTGISGVIKGSVHDWRPGETMHMALPNGQHGQFSFIDHKHTDPEYQRNLSALAGQNGLSGNVQGMSNARFDPKLGRMVVDVASNVRDPLGSINRAKQSGEYQQTKVNVNTPTRRRKGKK